MLRKNESRGIKKYIFRKEKKIKIKKRKKIKKVLIDKFISYLY